MQSSRQQIGGLAAEAMPLITIRCLLARACGVSAGLQPRIVLFSQDKHERNRLQAAHDCVIACPTLLPDSGHCVCLQRPEGSTTPGKPRKRQPLCPPDKESKGFTLGRGRGLTPPSGAVQPAAAPGASAALNSAADGAAAPQPSNDGLPEGPAGFGSASAPQLGPQAGAADGAGPPGLGAGAGQALLQQLRDGSGALADGGAAAGMQGITGEASSMAPPGMQGARDAGAAQSAPGVQAAGGLRANGSLSGAEEASAGPRSVQGTEGAAPAESLTPPGNPVEPMQRSGEASPAPVGEAEAGSGARMPGPDGYDGAAAAGVQGDGAGGMQPMGNSAAGQTLLQQLQAQPDQGELFCAATLYDAAHCLGLARPTKQRHTASRPVPSGCACVASVKAHHLTTKKEPHFIWFAL